MIFPLNPFSAYILAFAVLSIIGVEDWRDHRIRNKWIVVLSLAVVPIILANAGSLSYLIVSATTMLFWFVLGYYKKVPPGDMKLFVVVAWLWPSVIWQLTFWFSMMFQGYGGKKRAIGPDVVKAGIATVLICSVLLASLSGSGLPF